MLKCCHCVTVLLCYCCYCVTVVTAVPAAGWYNLSPALTLPTHLLGLADHAGPHLLHVHFEAAALAARAVPHIAPSLPLTGGAELVPGGRQLAGLQSEDLTGLS